MNEKTSKQWMEIVKPVAGGLVALMAIAAGYLQFLQQSTNDKMDSRVTALEVQVETIQPWREKVDVKMDDFSILLSDIRSDVSFIRGKMEAQSNAHPH